GQDQDRQQTDVARQARTGDPHSGPAARAGRDLRQDQAGQRSDLAAVLGAVRQRRVGRLGQRGRPGPRGRLRGLQAAQGRGGGAACRHSCGHARGGGWRRRGVGCTGRGRQQGAGQPARAQPAGSGQEGRGRSRGRL
ncbi:MAG: hypothetical protein AVDCRST_MAG50-202, partial [uncultured Acidimicrobiales bacterium]